MLLTLKTRVLSKGISLLSKVLACAPVSGAVVLWGCGGGAVQGSESSGSDSTYTASIPPAPQDSASTWTQEELERVSLEIQGDVEKLRGAQFQGAVPVRLSSKEQFVTYALERTERMEPKSKRAADETIQKMLGLIPPDMDLLTGTMRMLQDQVGGFYDPTTKTFYLMDNCPEGLAKIVLAHELGHALDDQLYDIDGTLKQVAERSDMALAYQSVVEGSGTAVMARWTKEHMKPMELLRMSSMEAEQTASMARSPMILWKPLMSAYLKGAAFLARTDNVMRGQMASGTNADIEQAFRFPPKSSEQILHPAKYWDKDSRDEPVAVQQSVNEAVLGDWKVLRRDVMGELALAIWCIVPAQRSTVGGKDIANAVGMDYTSPAAEGWGGDEILLLGTEQGARILRWVSAWDTARDAAEFFGAASMVLPTLEEPLTTLAGGKSSQTVTSIRYGGELEVIIELGYGARGSELKKLLGEIAGR